MLKKGLLIFLFVLAIGPAGLFAIDLGDGWSVTEMYPGSYSLDDNNRGICYAVNISEDQWGYYKLEIRIAYAVGKQYIKEKIEDWAIDAFIKDGLRFLGVTSTTALNAGATFITTLFKSSPAY